MTLPLLFAVVDLRHVSGGVESVLEGVGYLEKGGLVVGALRLVILFFWGECRGKVGEA